MRLLTPEREGTDWLTSESVRADYVYMYPPRQAYRSMPAAQMEAATITSLRQPGPLNVYVHVPFCRQICAFCNLYAVAGTRSDEHTRYVAALETEFEHYAALAAPRSVQTIYIGGGTPSLLSPELMSRVLRGLRECGFGDYAQVPEVALEVAPDTASPEALRGFCEAGINRINLGVQSWSDDELASIGRRHGTAVPRAALEEASAIGFANVCVDLIYGLDGQTDTSWRRSVQTVADFQPETICCYPLTLRSWTGFSRRGYTAVGPDDLYRRYDIAHELLAAAGYVQETHVRWVVPGRGGYVQKANHWAGQDVLGFGAGARSYLHHADLRNGYSVRHRRLPLAEYLKSVDAAGHARTDGFFMDDDERRRKDIILGLGYVGRGSYEAKHGVDPLERFPRELEQLEGAGLVEIAAESIRLTALGHRHRDVAVQLFFSERVRALVATHDYDE